MHNLVRWLGVILLYTGNGKGKTTSAVGTAIRARGRGKRVVFIQFMKARDSGEIKPLKELGVEVYRFGRKELVNLKNPSEEDKTLAKNALDLARKKLKENPFLIILDEVNVAVTAGLVDIKDVISLVKKAGDTHILLTGRYAPKELIELADLVTEMKEIKHPFQKGLLAVEGIDY